MKILLVDDSKKQRQAGISQLEGHEVVAMAKYFEAEKRVREGEEFDIALLDLLMPAEREMLGEEGISFLGESIGVGFPLAVKLAFLGIKKIAVATDTNHHNHPASAIMDWFGWEKVISIESSRVLFMHSPKYADGTKNWAKVLELLG